MSSHKLDERQLAELSRIMRSRYAALQQQATAALRDVGDPQYAAQAEQVHDLEDESVADVLQDVRLADVQRSQVEMQDIEQALARMHTGSFGKCMDCGRTITIARLIAYPTAKRCRACQEDHERRQIPAKVSSL